MKSVFTVCPLLDESQRTLARLTPWRPLKRSSPRGPVPRYPTVRPGAARADGVRLPGGPGVLGGQIENGLLLRRRLAPAAVGGEDRDDRGGEHEAGAGDERALVAVGRRLGEGVVAAVEQ